MADIFGLHKCHAIGCDDLTEPKMLMCRPHWHMVSGDVQNRVYKHYRKGQSVTNRPSREWLVAARAAITEVNKIEVEAMLRRSAKKADKTLKELNESHLRGISKASNLRLK